LEASNFVVEVFFCSRRPVGGAEMPSRRGSLSRFAQRSGYRRAAKPVVTGRKLLYLPRLMPKPISRSKTRKAVSKRFKITGTGKVMRQHASRRHLLSSKSAKRKRHMAKSAEVDKTDTARIKSNMPFG
jgi:large subunit ribosomal protein L35